MFCHEQAVDSVLADSFPASDPPSWTLGILRPQRKGPTNAATLISDSGRVSLLERLTFLSVILLIGLPSLSCLMRSSRQSAARAELL